MNDEAKSRNPLRKVTASLRALRERHEERHRPTGLGFAFADRVDYLDRETWDSVTSEGNLFLRRDVLRVLEQHGPENITPRYAMVFRGDKPAAILAAQIVSVTGEQLRREENVASGKDSSSLLRRALSPVAKVAGAKLRERILVAGNLLSWGFHGIAFARGEDPAEVWPGIAEALYRIRRAERLTGQTNFVLVKDLTEQQSGLETLRRFSYRPLETEPNMVLPIDPAWRNYDDYLTALDAKYRRNVKDQVKKLLNAGCTIEPLVDLAPHARRLHELYRAVQGNASVRLVTLGESSLPALARALGDDFRCTVVRRGDDILGFVTSLRDGSTAIAYYIGFDRAAAAEGLPIYLRLLHSTIGDAIAWRCERLSLGRTALEPKAALGAKPEPMTVWLRHRVPALNWMLRGILGAVPHEEAPQRNPFKSISAAAGN
ncbi:MAG: GNAT family N-acetyltransferase [Verrucomicrobia bacterium]|nr:GNAT family N-acetyltransferase [Verrucomicrobiota bacterium]